MNRQPTKCTAAKELLSTAYKEVKKLNIEKANSPVSKWAIRIREIVELLRTLFAHAEDLTSVHSTHTVQTENGFSVQRCYNI